MSFFIIKLLTPTSFKSGISFLETTISEFYNQESYDSNLNNFANRKETYCYTFNEHFSIHKNGQKELTFSMLKNIWLDDQLTINPFLSSLHNGTQLLLIDKYNNEYFFTIKDIKLNFKNKNIVYDFSCQDSFTYQLIRQNEGYTIENDPDSEYFIGAKNIDWWVYNKIAHDCHIGYVYVPLFQGLYLDKNNNLHTFLKESELQNVEKIVKPIYDKITYPEYYEEIPFSLSGSNADSALITLGENLSLNLNFKENNIKKSTNEVWQRTTQFERYFWFEPVKNENPSGLTYSPYTSISSFDLNFAGDALTTVLNVESNTINDELVTLIPEVPLFFQTFFNSNEWGSSQYTDGYFTSVCQGISYVLEDGNSSDNIIYDTTVSTNTEIVETTDESGNLIKRVLKIKIYNTNTTGEKFLLPSQYDLISFEKDDMISVLYINSTRMTPHTTKWELEIDGKIYNNTFAPIPNTIQSTEQEVYIVVDLPTTNKYSQIKSIENSKIILNFYRNASQDELDFAAMADKCPWLENKIIDLSFFLTQNIINGSEYNQIWNILRNDLRIVNGKLLLYSKSYYEALHQKTKNIATLINDLDSLGASFHSDAIDAYATKGVIDNLDSFSEAYKTIQSKYFSNTPTAILNYDELLTEYFNKYFKTQQRFLKNIYNFKKYFDTLIEWGGNSKLYQYTISINKTNNTETVVGDKTVNYVTLQNNQFIKIDNNFDLYNESSREPFVQIFDYDKQTILDIVHKNNYKQFYYPSEIGGSFARDNGSVGYNSHKTYYRCLYRFKIYDAENQTKIRIPNKFVYNSELYTYHSSDEDYYYYGPAKPDAQKETWADRITYSPQENITYIGEKTYKEVDINEIISEFIYNRGYGDTLENTGTEDLYYHETDSLSGINTNWINPDKDEAFFNYFSPLVWLRCMSKISLNSASPLYLTKGFLQGETINSDILPYVKDFYCENFPVKELKLIDQPKYVASPFTFKWKDQTFSTSYQRVNEKNQTVQDYINYWKDKKSGVVTEEVLNPTEYTQTYNIPLITPSNENEYYRRTLGAVNGGSLNNSVLSSSSLNTSNNALSQILLSGYLTTWNTSGLCLQDASGKFFNSNKNIVSGYIDIKDIVYTFSPEAYNLHLDLKAEREANDFIGTIKESSQAISLEQPPISIDDGNNLVYNETILATSSDNKSYLISNPEDLERGKNYFDKYSLLGLTYRSALSEQNTKLKYKDEWLRPMLLTDPVNKDAKYKILVQEIERPGGIKDTKLVFSNNDLTKIVPFSKIERYDSSNRLSKIVFYPILNSCEDVDLSTLDVSNGSSLIDLLASLNLTPVTQNESEYWITASYNNITFMFLFLEDEDFIRNPILSSDKFNKSNNYIYLPNRYSCYQNKKIYNEKEGIVVDLLKQEDLLKGFYYISDKDDNFISCESLEWPVSSNTHFYKKTDTGFERVYMVSQLIKKNTSSYYSNATDYQFEEFQTKFTKPLKVLLHKDIYKDGKITSSSTTQSREFYDFVIDEKYIQPMLDDNGNILYYGYELDGTIDDGSDEYKISYTVKRKELNDMSKMSNGQFWYLFHSQISNPILFEKAAVIETQLTTFWQQAYSSSLYCEYFIPEYWQPRIDGSTNYFSNKIFTIDDNDNIKISNYILPSVTLVSENGKTLLPTYNVKYNNKFNYSEDAIQQRINKTNTKPLSSLFKNEPFKQIFNNLGESNASSFVVEEIQSTKTNYYAGEGGLRWKEIVPKLSTYTYKYDLLDGLYIMTYKILKNSFSNRSFDTYEQLKEEQHQIWSNLYSRYSSILLENIYSNSDATTSQQLYTLASNFLKDKTEPEKGYSISIIDLDRLHGYVGEELLIGSSIKINSEDYIDDNSYIAKSISQYLFITDLSYDLRKSSDVKITVNSIKYQDKLIQRLVKLIK